MGMNINPSRRDEQPGGIDFPPPLTSLAADRRDYAAVDRDITCKCGRARAIDDFAITNYEIVHGSNLPKATKLGALLTGKVRAGTIIGTIICRAMNERGVQGWSA